MLRRCLGELQSQGALVAGRLALGSVMQLKVECGSGRDKFGPPLRIRNSLITRRIGGEVAARTVDTAVLLGFPVVPRRQHINQDMVNDIPCRGANFPPLNPSIAVKSRGHLDVDVRHDTRRGHVYRFWKPNDGIGLAQLPFGGISPRFRSVGDFPFRPAALHPRQQICLVGGREAAVV